jgi:hypothetical protein
VLSVRFEKNETVIYVKGQRFKQCKMLLLSIPIEKIENFDELSSIDEAARFLDHFPKVDQFENIVPPKVEFWGHSSNLQAWYEHYYDTCLLHSNIAFPLLKRLTEAGDPKAIRVFKDEIVKRLESGHFQVIEFLFEEGYLTFLNFDEKEYIFEIICKILLNEKIIKGIVNYENHLKAIPLLNRLAEAGVPNATRMFKDEVVKGLESGNIQVIKFLREDGYLTFFNFDEKSYIFEIICKILQSEKITNDIVIYENHLKANSFILYITKLFKDIGEVKFIKLFQKQPSYIKEIFKSFTREYFNHQESLVRDKYTARIHHMMKSVIIPLKRAGVLKNITS